ncbi:MAG: 3-dehydroquinate synthase [Bacteroidaceae bacterium]|nr:3-dehydroquinate synthase [Bacteroidaceae bacterium]
MEQQEVLFTPHIGCTLAEVLSRYSYDKLFILTDTNTSRLCMPLLQDCEPLKQAMQITIPADDTHKNIESLSSVWMALSSNGATRKSFLVNLGGGMITDLGAFAASTFKRGIAFINVPTTLLGAVDAAVGGKTGINFNGLKNEIGVFNSARAVVIGTEFFHTLSAENLLSGYAEMLKHGLISDSESYNRLIAMDMQHPDMAQLLRLLEESVKVKERVVAEDPFEKGLRKSLNLGHTVGHAFESLSHERHTPIMHGYAVAWGLVCELLLSHIQLGFPIERIRQLAMFVRENYGVFHITCKDYARLYELMTHDKKNESSNINFTLLTDVGNVKINCTADRKEIETVLDLYRDLFNI